MHPSLRHTDTGNKMMRAVGAMRKAVASVEMAVPPAMVAGGRDECKMVKAQIERPRILG